MLIASDSPHLGIEVGAAAFQALEDHDLVLGPTYDGGYALIGVRGGHDVLDGIEMSRSDVVDRIRARAHALNLRTAMLPATFDVDWGPRCATRRGAHGGLNEPRRQLPPATDTPARGGREGGWRPPARAGGRSNRGAPAHKSVVEPGGGEILYHRPAR